MTKPLPSQVLSSLFRHALSARSDGKLQFPRLEVGYPNKRAASRRRDRHPALSLGIGPVIRAPWDSGDAGGITLLTVRVSAVRRASLPIIGIPIGPPPNRTPENISALIRFMHPDTGKALLPHPLAGIWVPEDHVSLPESDASRQIESTIAAGNSLLLLVAAKVTGESNCYGLEISMTEGLVNSDLAIAEPEVNLQIDLAAEALTAVARYQLQNPDGRLEDFSLTKS